MKEYFSIGKISKPHGVKGEVNLIPFNDDEIFYKNLKNVFLSDNCEEINKFEEHKIVSLKFKNKKIVIKFDGYNSCNDAENLRNKLMIVKREELPLNDGEYFIGDIKGCEVYDVNSKFLGKIYDVIQTKNNDVYWIKKTEFNDELLIPALSFVVLDINVNDKKVIIEAVERWSS